MRYLKYIVLIFIVISFLNDCSFNTLTIVKDHPESGKFIYFKENSVKSITLSDISYFNEEINDRYDFGIIQNDIFGRLLGDKYDRIVKFDVFSDSLFLIRKVFVLRKYGLSSLFSSDSIYFELEEIKTHKIYVLYYSFSTKEIYSEYFEN